MSVNATNVYTCSIGGKLRKDHHGNEQLPDEYFKDPAKHYKAFEDNYKQAQSNNPTLFNAIKNFKPNQIWNPFKFFTP